MADFTRLYLDLVSITYRSNITKLQNRCCHPKQCFPYFLFATIEYGHSLSFCLSRGRAVPIQPNGSTSCLEWSILGTPETLCCTWESPAFPMGTERSGERFDAAFPPLPIYLALQVDYRLEYHASHALTLATLF